MGLCVNSCRDVAKHRCNRGRLTSYCIWFSRRVTGKLNRLSRSGYLHPISEISDCDGTSALSGALLEKKGRIFKRFRILLRPCRSMPVVFEFYCSKDFYLFYFLKMYSSLIICLRTSHDLRKHNAWGRWNHAPKFVSMPAEEMWQQNCIGPYRAR